MTKRQGSDAGRGKPGCAIGVILFAVVLLGLVAMATVKQAWADDRPWYSAFVAEHWAIPVTAFIAAAVAVTTGWWTVSTTRAADEREQNRWEKDRTAEKERWEADRSAQLEQARELRTREVERTLRDRFHEVVGLLSSQHARVRQAAVYSLVALSDDWAAHYGPGTDKARVEQQVCINTLIAQLLDPIDDEESGGILVEIVALKHVVQSLIISRLAVDHPNSWSSFDLVFDRCLFHDFQPYGVVHSAPVLSFRGARFAGQSTSFDRAWFKGSYVTFEGAEFKGQTSFEAARFTGKRVEFDRATFHSIFGMREAKMEGITELSFNNARFDNSLVDLTELQVKANSIQAWGASFVGADMVLRGVRLNAGTISAFQSTFFRAELNSYCARIVTEKLDLSHARFSDARISAQGMTIEASSVDFEEVRLDGTVVDVSGSELSFPRSKLLERLDDERKLIDDAANYTDEH